MGDRRVEDKGVGSVKEYTLPEVTGDPIKWSGGEYTAHRYVAQDSVMRIETSNWELLLPISLPEEQ